MNDLSTSNFSSPNPQQEHERELADIHAMRDAFRRRNARMVEAHNRALNNGVVDDPFRDFDHLRFLFEPQANDAANNNLTISADNVVR